MRILDEKLTKIKSVINEIKTLNGDIYVVGGSVRDALIGKPSKDLDVVVTGIHLDSLLNILGRNGKIKEVGKSFGVIKFVPFGETEEIDVALPRTEKKISTGYTGFEITVDELLPLEEDLKRRDFTINSIGYSSDGHLVDPFNGLKDIQRGIIRMTNATAFGEDPLRMLRAVQFSSRFGFKIESETLEIIKQNAPLIKEISPERILIEFEKIVSKGNPTIGAKLLVETGLFNYIFEVGFVGKISIWRKFKKVKTLGEFLTLLFLSRTNFTQNEIGSEFFKNKMKGDTDTYREIKALETGLKTYVNEKPTMSRLRAFEIYKICPSVFNTDLFEQSLTIAIEELKTGKFPKTLKELKINGDDLLNLGYKGTEIGKALGYILYRIYAEEIENSREKLLEVSYF